MILCITKQRGARLSNISHKFKSYNTLMAFTKCARVCGNLDSGKTYMRIYLGSSAHLYKALKIDTI